MHASAAGRYALSASLLDVWIALIFGVVGFFARRHGFSVAPIAVGLILGHMVEVNLQNSLKMFDGAWWMILTQPLALLFLILAFLGLFGSQIVKLIGTTKETITKIRERTHWNISNISAKHPAMLGLCKQTDLDAAIEKAGGTPHVEEQVSDISELP